MTPIALALVLSAAFIHAGWNLLAKKTGGDIHFALLTTIGVIVIWSPVGLWFAWREAGGYGVLQWALIAASGAIHVGYYLCLLRGYRLGDLSVVYPLARGTGPLITAVTASWLLNEVLGVQGWLGVAGVVVGIVLIAGGPALWRSLRDDAKAGVHRRDHDHDRDQHRRLKAGVGYGLLTGVFIAAYSVVDGYAVKRGGVSPVLIDWLGSVARLVLLLPLVALTHRGRWHHARVAMGDAWRQTWRATLIISTISPVAYVMVLYAVTMAPLSQVAPMREVSMLFAALMGGTLLGERDAGVRLLGAACIAAGVIALAWA
jgi:drug/metabolite transporter (DMT)-like permease